MKMLCSIVCLVPGQRYSNIVLLFSAFQACKYVFIFSVSWARGPRFFRLSYSFLLHHFDEWSELLRAAVKSQRAFEALTCDENWRWLFAVYQSIPKDKTVRSDGEFWILSGRRNSLDCGPCSFIIINQRAAEPKEQFGARRSYAIAESVISLSTVI